jgi:hypothetical protein
MHRTIVLRLLAIAVLLFVAGTGALAASEPDEVRILSITSIGDSKLKIRFYVSGRGDVFLHRSTDFDLWWMHLHPEVSASVPGEYEFDLLADSSHLVLRLLYSPT